MFYTFLRSARNFEEFSSAKKHIVYTDLTRAEAYEACREYNSDLSDKEKMEGTKMEFQKMD